MATTFGGIVLDTPDYKIFDIVVPEVDAAGAATETVLTYAAGLMSNLRTTPQVYWTVEHTAPADNPTVTVKIGLHTLTNLAFTVCKTSATAATAQSHTFRVFVTTKRLYEI